jgi:hypothetical protein
MRAGWFVGYRWYIHLHQISSGVTIEEQIRRSQTLINLWTGKWKAVLALLVFAGPLSGSLILNIQSTSASPNTSGNAFDVTVTNTGPSAVSIDGFGLGIHTASSLISFTDATTGTTVAPYIFGVDGFAGSDLTGPTSGQSLTTSDLDSVSAVSVASGASFGLAHVLFSVAPGASGGGYNVDFTSPATSLSDAAGFPLTIDTLNGGTITVTSTSTVPEPSSMAPLTLVLLIGCSAVLRRRARA